MIRPHMPKFVWLVLEYLKDQISAIFHIKKLYEGRHANKIKIAILFLFVVLASIMIAHLFLQKSVTLMVDGRMQVFKTSSETWQDFIAQQNINITSRDSISKPLYEKIRNEDRLEIRKAIPVDIQLGNYTRKLYTAEKTVGQAIRPLKLGLSKLDRVEPSIQTPLKYGMKIKVTHIKKEIVQEKQAIPFQTVEKQDPSMKYGEKKLIQTGMAGSLVKKVEQLYVNGSLVSEQLLDKKVSTKQIDRIFAVGVKAIPKATVKSKHVVNPLVYPTIGNTKKQGINFAYKKVINNVMLTAYSSEEPGLGTITASGTTVQEGRTIAVDKNVIPMGWWVYIEGIGFRRAEDTGGAIKGNIIDVYIQSLKKAIQFGRKRGHTVYVIGPEKPAGY